jgi:hypothetical protein
MSDLKESFFAGHTDSTRHDNEAFASAIGLEYKQPGEIFGCVPSRRGVCAGCCALRHVSCPPRM